MTLQSRLTFRKQLLLVAGLSTSLLTLGASAFAEEATAAPKATPQDQPDEDAIQTVLVTANKRTENAQRVPISISAITADTASKVGVVNGQTLAQAIPGLALNRQTNGTTPFLRGVGNPSTQAGSEPAVAMYVDDVYYGSSAVALTNYNSIQRIEVLKGPQGTLFGRNATGGVINVFTKNPSQESALDIGIGYANYRTASGSLYATGKIAEGVAANLAVYGEKQSGGWGHNYTTGNLTYLQHNYGGRAKMLWDISDATTLLLNVDYDDYANQQAVYFRPAPGTKSNAGATSIPPAFIYDTNENLDPHADVKQYGGSGKLTHDFSAARLVSISAYRHTRALQQFAQDGSSIFRLNPLLVYTDKVYTQEFQVLSPEGSAWSWVGGAFFLKDSVTVDPFQFSGALPGGGLSSKGAFATQDTKSYSGFFQGTVPLGDKAHVTAGVRYTDDKRSLDAGRQNFSSAGVASPQVFATNSGLSESWSKVSGRLSLDYQFTNDIMGYVAYNRGFKSGLFNTIIAPSFAPASVANPIPTPAAPLIDPPVKPEDIDAITAGFKSEFLDHKLRLNVEAFHYKYKNLQLQQVFIIPGGGTATQLTNAAKATIKGIDLDVTIQPVKNLSLTAAVELLDGKYDDYPDGQFFVYNPVTGGNCAFAVPNAAGVKNPTGCLATPPNYDPATGHWNLKGNHTIQSPPFSFTLTGAYDIPLSSGKLSLALSFSHSGNYYADADNGLGQIAPSSQLNDKQLLLDIVNGSVTWYATNEKYSVRLWGKNLTDQRYWSFANETGTITKNVPAPPRTFGVTFMTHF